MQYDVFLCLLGSDEKRIASAYMILPRNSLRLRLLHELWVVDAEPNLLSVEEFTQDLLLPRCLTVGEELSFEGLALLFLSRLAELPPARILL